MGGGCVQNVNVTLKISYKSKYRTLKIIRCFSHAPYSLITFVQTSGFRLQNVTIRPQIKTLQHISFAGSC